MMTIFSLMVTGIAWDSRIDSGMICHCKAPDDKECVIDKTDMFLDGPHDFILLRDSKTKKPAKGTVKVSCEKH